MKEISVTDSFMGLDKDARKCQIETYDDCKTRLYIEHLKQICGCLPLSLRLSREVKHIIYYHDNWYQLSSWSPKSKPKGLGLALFCPEHTNSCLDYSCPLPLTPMWTGVILENDIIESLVLSKSWMETGVHNIQTPVRITPLFLHIIILS